MHILVTMIAVGILIVGIYFNKKDQVENSSEETVEIQTQESSPPSSDESEEEEEELEETSTPSPTPNSEKATSSKQTSTLSEFRYPGSNTISQSDSEMELESSDNATDITNWYKEKIRQIGFNVKSFVTTKTNGNVINKLVGADEVREVNVEIKKGPEDSITKITVVFE